MAEESNEERRVNLDLVDEAREEAKIKAEAVKRKVERQYSSKVKPRQFQIGDLVTRKAHPYELENKLSPKWTGPFRITEAKGNGSYNLETLEGGPIPRSWNAANLNCTALVVGSDDVASSYSIGVLTRRQVGRREGSRGAREVASY